MNEIDRITPTLRASCPASRAMVQKWRNLLFVHWEVPLHVLRALIPSELTIDTFDGRAFIGLVPFTMRGIRLAYLPPVPGTTAFHETNVRTYVHRQGRDPGVWFFSLDAANALAVKVARAQFHLPYFKARMEMHVQNARIDYRSERLWPDPAGHGAAHAGHGAAHAPASIEARWHIGEALEGPEPGTLEHFLVERYILYAQSPRGLRLGRVHHTPYPVHSARIETLRENLVETAGIRERGAILPALYSPGVDVDVFSLEPLTP